MAPAALNLVVGTKRKSMCQAVFLYALTSGSSQVIIFVQMVLDTLWGWSQDPGPTDRRGISPPLLFHKEIE